jgi:hypothetical protein
MIKRLFLSLCGFITLLVVLLALAIFFFLDTGIETGVERIGPRMTQSRVELGEVQTSIFGGMARIDDLVVRNPSGYDSPYALQIGSAEVKVVPGTIFDEVIVVESIRVNAPAIVIERENGVTNLEQLQRNISTYLGGPSEEPTETTQPASGKRYIIREFVVEAGKFSGTLMGVQMDTNLPRIELRDIGASQDGFSAEEASSVMIEAVLGAVSRSAKNQAVDLLSDPEKAIDTLNRATGLLNSLFGNSEGDQGG